ncbi:hypothetical protein [Blastopirellula marina]|uniref:Uncharacterized protein n=1 Tax=Blastopirellula marina DSM 3645 TaxID=314230 RepID=A3ZS95_9BACT|nr:hypothetical protein [Blastopirellula marina]EAQ80553.1 hypothetical protein DSM3645_14445 [Blastopirellula marina DSM 3645]
MESDYQDAIHRFLGWFAVACVIAAIHAGPVTILVWLAVAYVLTSIDGPGTPGSGGKPGSCGSSKRHK